MCLLVPTEVHENLSLLSVAQFSNSMLHCLLNVHIPTGVAYAFIALSIIAHIYPHVLFFMSPCQEIWLVKMPDSLI